MTLIILEILSLEALISLMATTICSSLPLVSTDLCCDCPATPAADWEFSAFLRDMELISSLEAKVSSSEAACSLAPCASDWLTDETWPAALATWAVLPAISATNHPRGSFALRNTIRTTPPTAMASAMNTSAIQRLDAVVPPPVASRVGGEIVHGRSNFIGGLAHFIAERNQFCFAKLVGLVDAPFLT